MKVFDELFNLVLIRESFPPPKRLAAIEKRYNQLVQIQVDMADRSRTDQPSSRLFPCVILAVFYLAL